MGEKGLFQKRILGSLDDAGIDAGILKVWDGKDYADISLVEKLHKSAMNV